MYGSQTCADVEGVRAIPDHDMCSEATQDMAISDDISCSYSGASCSPGQDESSEVSSTWQNYDVSGCFKYGSTKWNPKSGNRFKCDSGSYFVSISNCCLFFYPIQTSFLLTFFPSSSIILSMFGCPSCVFMQCLCLAAADCIHTDGVTSNDAPCVCAGTYRTENRLLLLLKSLQLIMALNTD